MAQAKDFYQGLGWRLDADFSFNEGFRVAQLTPPGSGCSSRPTAACGWRWSSGFIDAYVVNVAVRRCHGCAVPVPQAATT